jgi:hypothetical protein
MSTWSISLPGIVIEDCLISLAVRSQRFLPSKPRKELMNERKMSQPQNRHSIGHQTLAPMQWQIQYQQPEQTPNLHLCTVGAFTNQVSTNRGRSSVLPRLCAFSPLKQAASSQDAGFRRGLPDTSKTPAGKTTAGRSAAVDSLCGAVS